nr:hypothetical protein [Agrobacterium tumefaciens]
MGKALGPSMAELIDWAIMRTECRLDENAIASKLPRCSINQASAAPPVRIS